MVSPPSDRDLRAQDTLLVLGHPEAILGFQQNQENTSMIQEVYNGET